MTKRKGPPKVKSDFVRDWEAKAWVYFIWVVSGERVYCKVGYSINPDSRYRQIVASLPERPYRFDLLPCLNVQQAQYFEKKLHNDLYKYQVNNEWFFHPNLRFFQREIQNGIVDIFELFRTFDYRNELIRIEKDGLKPVLSYTGYVSHFTR